MKDMRVSNKHLALTLLSAAFLLWTYQDIWGGNWSAAPFNGSDWYPYLSHLQEDVGMLRHGQLPLVTGQFFCGNFPQYAGPEALVFYPPATVLFFLFPQAAAYRLFILLHAALGIWGFWALSGKYTKRTEVRVWGALVYGTSGAWIAALVWGLPNLVAGFALLPWFFHALDQGIAQKSAKFGALAGAALGAIALSGGWYIVLWSGLAAGIIAVHAWGQKKWETAKTALLGLAFGFVIVAGWRMALIVSKASQLVRVRSSYQGIGLADVLGSFVRPEITGHIPLIDFGGPILGFGIMGLSALGAWKGRKTWLPFLALFFLLFVQGNALPANSLFLSLPFFQLFSDMTRALFLLSLLFILLAVKGLDALLDSPDSKRAQGLAIGLLALTVPNLPVGAWLLIGLFGIPVASCAQIDRRVWPAIGLGVATLAYMGLIFSGWPLGGARMENNFTPGIFNEIREQVGDAPVYLSVNLTNSLVQHQMAEAGLHLVNPYDSYHFAGDFSCGRYYVGVGGENETEAVIYFSNRNPVEYVAELGPPRGYGEYQLYPVEKIRTRGALPNP